MKKIEVKTIPSPYPLICAIGIYIVGTFLLPMYKFSSIIILLVVAVAVYIALKFLKIFKDQTIEVEIPVAFESSQVEEIVKLGNSQVNTLKNLVNRIDDSQMKDDIQSIIHTSVAIIDLIEEHQEIGKKTKKYFRYYLEEVIKIIKSYDELEETSMDVDSIKERKAKISGTIHNASTSFIQYYNDLMEGKMMDIDVDLKVFDGMLDKMN